MPLPNQVPYRSPALESYVPVEDVIAFAATFINGQFITYEVVTSFVFGELQDRLSREGYYDGQYPTGIAANVLLVGDGLVVTNKANHGPVDNPNYSKDIMGSLGKVTAEHAAVTSFINWQDQNQS